MRLVSKLSFLILGIILVLGGAFFITALGGNSQSTKQNGETITLTVSLPLQTTSTAGFFEEFRETHPDVNIVISSNPPGPAGFSWTLDTEAYLNSTQTYIESGDVLFIYSSNVLNEVTQAGQLLNLRPLADADAAIKVSDYVPELWQSFQWDGGLWALPLSGTMQMMAYDKQQFDRAGLAYPEDSWSVENFFHLIETLTGRSDIRPLLAIQGNDLYILRSLVENRFYSLNAQGEYVPEVATSDVINTLDRWLGLQQRGLVGDISTISSTTGSFGYVMQIPSSVLYNKATFNVVPYPGGHVGLQVYGFAVNPSTPYPDLAYELAQHLSQNLKVFTTYNVPMLDIPAYKPLDGDLASIFPERDPRIDQLLPFSLTPNEVLYTNYVNEALRSAISSEASSIDTALVDIQNQASSNLATASRLHSETMINAPTVAPTLPVGQIELTFGGISEFTPPDTPLFLQIVNEFVEQDAEIGRIRFIDYYPEPLSTAVERLDCFYTPESIVGMSHYQEHLLAIEPLILADGNFERASLLKGLWEALEYEDALYGFPIAISPFVIGYNPEELKAEGFPDIPQDWSYNDFRAVLESLHSPDDETPFSLTPKYLNTHYILMLTAAAGGLLYDYNTSPPTPAFTNENAVTALREVLDLARNQRIGYTEIGMFGGRMSLDTGWLHLQTWLDAEIDRHFALQSDNPETASNYVIQLLPVGQNYAPAAYHIGAGYITKTTPYVDACYRWLRFMAEQPHIYSGIPARTTIAESPTIETAKGRQVSNFYTRYIESLEHPQTIIIPIHSSRFAAAPQPQDIEDYWLAQAFNAYALNHEELVAVLTTAQNRVEEYRACLGNTADTLECAQRIDPEIR